jgi:hypothetical protein
MGRKSVTERSDNRLLRLGFDLYGIDEAVFSTHTLQHRLSKTESSLSRSPNVYCKSRGQTFHPLPVNTSFPVLRAKNRTVASFSSFGFPPDIPRCAASKEIAKSIQTPGMHSATRYRIH